MTGNPDPDQAAQDAARATEEERRAALGKEYQQGLDRAGEAYAREQERQAEDRKAAALKGDLQDAWEAQRSQQARDDAGAADARTKEETQVEAVRQAEREARDTVQQRLALAKEVRSHVEDRPANRPPTWEQVKEAEQERRGREENRLLEWQEKDRQALISRAEGRGWPHEELIEKLRSQAETHALQQERQVQDQQERLERLRLTNGKERDRTRDRSLER